MASNDKVLWILPRSAANELIGALVATTLVALLFSWLLALDFIADNAWVEIIVWLLFAAIIGYAVGMIRGASSTADLWVVAGFTAIGLLLTTGFIGGGAAGAGVDAALLSTIQNGYFFSLDEVVPFAYVILGLVAVAIAPLGSKK